MATVDNIIGKVEALPKGEQRKLLLLLHDRLNYRCEGLRQPPMIRFRALDEALSGLLGVRTITERCRYRSVVWARHLVAYQMRTDGYTFNEIGRCLRRDHSTIINSCKQVEAMFANPRQFPQEFFMLRTMRERAGGPAA